MGARSFLQLDLFPIGTWLDPWIMVPAVVVVLSLVVARSKRPVYHAIFSIITFAAITVLLLTQGPRIE